MKAIRYIQCMCIALSVLFISCEDVLEENVYDQLAPENFLTNTEGMESVMGAAYAATANMRVNNSIYTFAQMEWTTDIMWQTGDGVNATAVQYINFTWDPTVGLLRGENWDWPYQGIRNANIILDNMETLEATDSIKTLYAAEARFLRVINYYKMYLNFGPVPLRTSTAEPLQLPRASEEEMLSFIENEWLNVIPDLPNPGDEVAYGRAHKAAAQGYLAEFYMNTRQWNNAAEMTATIINQWDYSLFPEYEDLFKVENERNAELIWVRPAKSSADRYTANSWMNAAYPPDFAKDPRTGLEFKSAWRNWPNEFRILDDFYNSFDPEDERRTLILTEYINTAGDTISLLNEDNTRSFKFWPDPEGANASYGNDIPEIRYADILLLRAEALNEINGPNQESIDLINMVRERAGLEGIQLANFSGQESLRNHILQERGWEFYSEGKRRNDLIRMGQYISNAQARGITNAQAFHVRFPIPLDVMDSNPELVQNEGY
ncbi:RagB/SusD family nutrient uptake outer membrane protein [Catalinimonas niigatensis]|uniref:RagB/SusD family nutrient uptake outer membrane protein n=1 Tax=Catalinimonas niigatensis TaxID=1397264 RepID=UPI00266633BC|nr:RagB/SusD family nutrient uptake outer membrane protein [Catalinimonas niigatensis]WPP51894.1 RagB/SusD family nutrient uptake outer membrane protein [Catalinimonas niigatensis]